MIFTTYDYFIAISNFLIYIILATSIVLFIGFIPRFIRSYRFKNIANDFNLSFNKGKSFYILTPKEIKRNILKGNISWHNILLYDCIDMEWYKIPIYIPIRADYLAKRRTILSIDNQSIFLRGFFGGYPSIRKVRKALKNIN